MTVSGRYCIAALALWYWAPGFDLLERRFFYDAPWYAISLGDYYYAAGILIVFFAGAALIGRPPLRDIVGRPLSPRDAGPVAVAVVISFFGAGALSTLIPAALSFVVPAFVTWWLDWSGSTTFYFRDDGSVPIVANALRLASLVIMAPVLEELIFRGYLLHAWSRKWGLWNGVLLSSALFAALHADTVSTMLSGVVYALVYLRTQSLWAPMITHAAHNLGVWLWNLADVVRADGNYWEYAPYTIDDLRSWVWIAMLQLLLVVLVVDRLLRRRKLGPFRLPLQAGQA